MPGQKGSPRTALAASILIKDAALTIEEAMRRAKFPLKACQSRKRQKNVSQKKIRMLKAAAIAASETVTPALPAEISLLGSSNASSTITGPNFSVESRGERRPFCSISGDVNKIPTKRVKSLASNSRRTPGQVLKAHIEQEKLEEVRRVAHEWALQQLSQEIGKNAEEIARQATAKFKIQVLGNTLRKMRTWGSTSYIGQGKRPAMSEEDLNAICQGIIGWISICQINGDPEKGNKDMEIILGEVLKNSNQSKADPKWLWTKVKRKIGSYLTLSNARN